VSTALEPPFAAKLGEIGTEKPISWHAETSASARLFHAGRDLIADRDIRLATPAERDRTRLVSGGLMSAGLVDDQFTALAAVGVEVKSRASEGWEQAKKTVTALWRRVRLDRADTVATDLVGARADLLAAQAAGDQDSERDLVLQWRNRLRRLLAADPDLATPLYELVARLGPGSAAPVSTVGLYGHATGHGRVDQAGDDLHGNDR
jgi:hypothetical protein